jgi:hypothetical protein
MSPWKSFYKGRCGGKGGASYFEYFKKQYEPFLRVARIFAASAQGPSLELGAGLGNTTAYLQELDASEGMHREHHVLEQCPEMGVLLQRRFGSSVTHVRACALEYTTRKPYHLVHSHGLLEHFTDAEITKIIGNHRGAAAQVHYVPGEGHGEPSFGDERLLPIDHWVDLTRPDSHFTFNDGKDYCLVYFRR